MCRHIGRYGLITEEQISLLSRGKILMTREEERERMTHNSPYHSPAKAMTSITCSSTRKLHGTWVSSMLLLLLSCVKSSPELGLLSLEWHSLYLQALLSPPSDNLLDSDPGHLKYTLSKGVMVKWSQNSFLTQGARKNQCEIS